MKAALLFVAQKYSNIVLGTGLKQYHHFYWIEGDDGDPFTKKRQIIPYTGRVSRTLVDRGYAEVRNFILNLLLILFQLVINDFCDIFCMDYIRKKKFRNHSSRNWKVRKRDEILRKIFYGIFYRIIRTSSFPNPTYSSMNLYMYLSYIFIYCSSSSTSINT